MNSRIVAASHRLSDVSENDVKRSGLGQLRKASCIAAGVLALAGLGACDGITALDNRDAPSSTLTGRVLYNGEPVGVRHHGVELELWEPAYEEQYGQRVKIPVYIGQDGSFTATLFDGTYKLNKLANNGPWVNSMDTTLIVLNGSAEVDVEVTPYYTIDDVSFTRGAPTEDVPGGSISATFRVGKIDTTRDVEFVALYIGTTNFVDRINGLPIPDDQRELSGAAVQPQLDANQNITISVNLPETIYQSDSPWVRDFVFARVGVKTEGVAELLYTQLFEVPL